jgi:hypothetical protein
MKYETRATGSSPSSYRWLIFNRQSWDGMTKKPLKKNGAPELVNSQLEGSIKDLANQVIKNQEKKDQSQEFGVDLHQALGRVV